MDFVSVPGLVEYYLSSIGIYYFLPFFVSVYFTLVVFIEIYSSKLNFLMTENVPSFLWNYLPFTSLAVVMVSLGFFSSIPLSVLVSTNQ